MAVDRHAAMRLFGDGTNRIEATLRVTRVGETADARVTGATQATSAAALTVARTTRQHDGAKRGNAADLIICWGTLAVAGEPRLSPQPNRHVQQR
jgi:formylmethanofuran dehydrogenase subunit B